jgi:GDP-L-fucose synthase
LIRRFHEAKIAGKPAVSCWGTGLAKREFLHVDDLASACLFLLQQYSDPQFINVGSGVEVTIRELTELVKSVVGYSGGVEWDPSKPDGTPRKLMDSSRLFALGWKPRVDLGQGIRLAYQDFLNSQSSNDRRSG